MRISRGGAFTLIEMLVVIGIIAILAAILFPVFSSARAKARQTACIGQLHQIVVALKQYQEDYRGYPPAPAYDGTRFWGGVSSLWPDYISDQGIFFCPDDLGAKTRQKNAKDMLYSSYNANIDLTTDPSTWVQSGTDPAGLLVNRTYNYYGFDDTGFDVYDELANPYIRPTVEAPDAPWWLAEKGLTWRHYPRLMNRYAPDNTIVTYCARHNRAGEANPNYIVIRLGGEAKVVRKSEMSATISGPSGATVSVWVHQR